MTSSASISTQSAAGRPSIRTTVPNRSLILSASLVAIDATWRVERPEAITIWSAMFDLPASGMETTSTAWSSSSDWRTSAWSVFDVDRLRPWRRRSQSGRSVKWSPGDSGMPTLGAGA